MKNRYYIYGLKCPIDNCIKYIGMSVCPVTRRKQHMQNINPESEKGLWISELKKNSLVPEIIILDEIKGTKKQAMDLEYKLIVLHRKTNGSLLNRSTDIRKVHPLLLGMKPKLYAEIRKKAFEERASMTSIIIEAIQKHLKLKSK